MKIYLETKDKDNHRIVFVGNNGKLVWHGEFVRRKSKAFETFDTFLWFMQGLRRPVTIEVRPYKPGAFAKNSGPAKKSTTKKKK